MAPENASCPNSHSKHCCPSKNKRELIFCVTIGRGEISPKKTTSEANKVFRTDIAPDTFVPTECITTIKQKRRQTDSGNKETISESLSDYLVYGHLPETTFFPSRVIVTWDSNTVVRISGTRTLFCRPEEDHFWEIQLLQTKGETED